MNYIKMSRILVSLGDTLAKKYIKLAQILKERVERVWVNEEVPEEHHVFMWIILEDIYRKEEDYREGFRIAYLFLRLAKLIPDTSRAEIPSDSDLRHMMKTGRRTANVLNKWGKNTLRVKMASAYAKSLRGITQKVLSAMEGLVSPEDALEFSHKSFHELTLHKPTLFRYRPLLSLTFRILKV